MDRELVADLAELGLTATEAEIYVALLEQTKTGPVSAYKLAQDMGRDPANMTKTLGAMTKRGAVQATKGKPRLFSPVPPADFTGELIQHLHAKQRRVVKRLEEIGRPPDNVSLRPLETRQQALDVAKRLLGEARRIVLVDASPDQLGELAPELARAVSAQGATVLAKSTSRVAIPGVRVWTDPGEDALAGAAPGPWLRIAVDGHGSLEALVHPGNPDQLLHGFWTRSPSRAFLAHRSLAAELILADVGELLRAGASADLVSRRAADQAALILRQVTWRQRWREAGLPEYPPADAEGADVALEAVTQALAEQAAHAPGIQTPAAEAFTVEAPPAATPAALAAADGEGFQAATPGVDESADASLQFIFRKRRQP